MLNPSHLLLARNLRSPAEPHITSSSFSLSDAPPRGISSTCPRPDYPGGGDGGGGDRDDGGLDIHPTFRGQAGLKGTVKVVVQGEVFWCHKEVLYFASPFFEAILSGEWVGVSIIPGVVEMSLMDVIRLDLIAGQRRELDLRVYPHLSTSHQHPTHPTLHQQSELVIKATNPTEFLGIQDLIPIMVHHQLI